MSHYIDFNNSSNNNSSDFNIAKIPYSLDAERSVLGAILIFPEKYNDIAETISSNDFYLENHKRIYDSITNLYLKSRSIDLVTLLDEIDSKNPRSNETSRTETREYLVRLTENVPVIENIKEYAGIVKEKSLRRKLITASQDIIKLSQDDPAEIDDILDRAQQKIFELAQGRVTQDFVHVSHILVNVFGNIQNIVSNRETALGISSGFSGIDNILVGMNAGDLIVIGSRPGMGKTAFAMNLALNVASKKKTIAVFQLEMSKEQLVLRLLSSDAFVDSFKLRAGILGDEDWKKIMESGSRISECNIYIDDTPSITITGMKAKLRTLKNLDMVIIDYLQLMQTDRNSGNRVQDVSEISRNLKIMAKELGVPIVACAQLARGPETRDDKRPLLSDLRESGAIEQDADVVMFLYRDSYYKKTIENNNRAEIIFAKNRHGSVGKIEVGFEEKFTRFYDIDELHKE